MVKYLSSVIQDKYTVHFEFLMFLVEHSLKRYRSNIVLLRYLFIIICSDAMFGWVGLAVLDLRCDFIYKTETTLRVLGSPFIILYILFPKPTLWSNTEFSQPSCKYCKSQGPIPCLKRAVYFFILGLILGMFQHHQRVYCKIFARWIPWIIDPQQEYLLMLNHSTLLLILKLNELDDF